MERRYILAEKLSIKDLVRELYDFSKLGAISLPGVLTPMAVEDLVNVAELNMHLFRDVPRYEGTAEQEMRVLYLEKIQRNELSIESLSILDQFRGEYLKIYNDMAQEAQFDERDFNKIGFHHYPSGSIGITPHQDYERHINLISIFNLVGNTKFYCCQDECRRGAYALETAPGSLILLRAARKREEQRFRPYHYIEPMEYLRLSLNIRKRVPM